MNHGLDAPRREPMRRLPGPSRREVIAGLAAELEAGGIQGAVHEAERLLCYVLDVSRTDLLLRADSPVSPEEAGRIATVSRRRLSGVPLQHIEGTVAFRDLELLCDGRALVPRPETEQLVQRVVDWAFSRETTDGVRRVRRSATALAPALDDALDIGTGSGAIALSLIHERVAERAVAVDISSVALEQARQNALRAGLEQRVDFRRVVASPWDVIGSEETFDVIVSNPPYIADGEVEALAPEVRDHDPRIALAGGVDGLDLVRAIVNRAMRHLRPGGGLFLEVGDGQAERVRGLLEDMGSWRSVEALPDLAGRGRFVIALR